MANTHKGSDDHSDSKSHSAKSGASHDDKSHEKSASGKKGVTQEQVGSGKEHDPNNFANNPDRAAAAGRKGGHNSHG